MTDLEAAGAGDASCNAHAGATGGSTAALAKDRKRKVVIYVAYVGAGYSGMQANPGAITIERVLEEAIHKAGGISDDNAHDFAKLNWMRAARTDKGVSAVGQVVSLKMMIGQPDIVERINAHLPDHIRVFGFTRVTNGFDARHLCDRRRYEYVLPAFVFDTAASLNPPGRGKVDGSPTRQPAEAQAPPSSSQQHNADATCASHVPVIAEKQNGSGIAAVASSRQAGTLAAGGTASRTGEVADVLALGPEVLAAGQSRETVMDARALVSAAASDLQHDQQHTRPAPTGLPANPPTIAPEAGASDVLANAQPATRPGTFSDPNAALASHAAAGRENDGQDVGPAERVSTGEEQGAAAGALNGIARMTNTAAVDTEGSKERPEEGGTGTQNGVFVFDEVKRAELNNILRQYVGTNNYHNFTSKMPGGDPAAMRYILSFQCTGTFQLAGQTWVRMVVVGQSFILHQIRKMVGLAVAVMRGVAPSTAVPIALDPLRNFNVPMAPELGLFLDECIFAGYNSRWGEDREELVSLEPFQAQVTAFKEKLMYPQIAERDALEAVNVSWLRNLTEENYQFSKWENLPTSNQKSTAKPSTFVADQGRWENRDGRRGKRKTPPNRHQGTADKRPQSTKTDSEPQSAFKAYSMSSASVAHSMDAEWSD